MIEVTLNIEEEKQKVNQEINHLTQQLTQIEQVRNNLINEIVKKQGILSYIELLEKSKNGNQKI